MKPRFKATYAAQALTALEADSAAVAYALLAPSINTSNPHRHRLTLAGKLKVSLLRALPNKAFMSLWNKGRKMPIKAVQAIEGYSKPTRYGAVPCKLYYPLYRAGQSIAFFFRIIAVHKPARPAPTINIGLLFIGIVV